VVEAALKSPSVPLFQRGKFWCKTLTLFGKEGKRRFLGGVRKLRGELLVRKLEGCN
jgi:hypothetical protein